jgi:hypothetical protein
MTFCNQQPIQDSYTAGILASTTSRYATYRSQVNQDASNLQQCQRDLAMLRAYKESTMMLSVVIDGLVQFLNTGEPLRNRQLTTLTVILHGSNSPHL